MQPSKIISIEEFFVFYSWISFIILLPIFAQISFIYLLGVKRDNYLLPNFHYVGNETTFFFLLKPYIFLLNFLSCMLFYWAIFCSSYCLVQMLHTTTQMSPFSTLMSFFYQILFYQHIQTYYNSQRISTPKNLNQNTVLRLQMSRSVWSTPKY
jgi:hypothetical protein